MAFRHFTVGLAGRLFLVGAAMLAVIWLAQQGGYLVGTAIASVIFLILVAELWRYINRTNREVRRFLAAVRHADF